MSVPKIGLVVEPLEAGKVVFLPMAPKDTTEKPRGRIMLRLTISNQEDKTVIGQSIKVSFPGSSLAAEPKSVGKTLLQNASVLWWFMNPSDDVVFDLPGPGQIKLEVKVSGFSDLKEFVFPLAPHISPVSGGAYLFPAKATDLGFGEFWTMNGCTHSMGNEGSQSFAYDMGVWAHNPDTGSFDWKRPGADGTANEHMRVFGKPLYGDGRRRGPSFSERLS